MKAGVFHCHCSKCYSVPARKRIRKRPSAVTLLSLPEEVILCVLQCLSAEDLLSIRAVHSQLRDIVDNHSSIWARVSFRDKWPSPNTLWLFERAAEKGNFEAAVKLGIAFLYNEGPLLSDEGRADVCGRKASHFFSLAESLRSPAADPFIWVFIRPPWSPTGSCCKAVVFDRLKAECDNNVEDNKHCDAVSMLEESSLAGCVQSSYLLWEHSRKAAVSASLDIPVSDPGRYLQCIRRLRDYAGKGCWEAQLSLAKVYCSGNPLGLEPKARSDLVAQVFSSSNPASQHFLTLPGSDIVCRYILVDWLVEVTTMKDFSSLTLHVTVSCVDRYLARRSVPKARLQLLGIACMVVCTRYISKEILTIREAVWLTDNTYKYEDLVRMMGEVVSVLEGNIRSPTLLDYGEVLLLLLPLERRTSHLFSYICELSLLYSSLSRPPPAKLACAALLLTRALHHCAPIWPTILHDYTGFSKDDLVPLSVLLYVKCFSQDVPKDYRHISLTGVKQRFEDEAYQDISKEKVMDYGDLCQVLGIPEVEPQMETFSPAGQPSDIHTFLASPSSSKRRRDDGMQLHRGSFVATPTMELSNQEEMLLDDILDWSLDTSCSGYEGDREEESEGEREEDYERINNKKVLQPVFDADSRLEHCRALSSDEDSFCEEEQNNAINDHLDQKPLSFPVDPHSSGYSSVSPSSSCSPSLMPYTFKTFTNSLGGVSANAQQGFRLLVPMQRPRGTSSQQVKRKNIAAHSGGEVEEEGNDLKGGEYSASGGFMSL
uniref:Cyclin-F n=1 Tax=Gouania willdenowi TaxID=441366 RepID=A0A8C5EB30_GOUWI